MRHIKPLFLFFFIACAGLISACSGETPLDKAILGTWVQDVPFSITTRGVQTTTTDTVLRLKKNGETHLTRNLKIRGQDLPESGVGVSVELRGIWELVDGQLRQTPDTVLILPRDDNEATRQLADKLQEQAEKSVHSTKIIVAADKSQLILQDIETGTTDVYSRK